MAVTLLLDLGASRLKAALYDHETEQCFAQRDVASPVPWFGPQGEIQVDGQAHPTLVRDLCETLFHQAGCIPAQAVLCSEMHGFALDHADCPPCYVSWRDERAVRSGVLAQLQHELADCFRPITGMKLRAGLPILTLTHLYRHRQLTPGARLLSLPEWLVLRLGELSGAMDETMAAGMGLYDLDQKCWSSDLCQLIGGDSFLNLLCPVQTGQQSIGVLRLSGHEIPVLAAVGDLQAAVYGSGCPAVTSLCVNVGTGSQVNRIGYRPQSLQVEERPFFAGQRMATLSHIPAGRALRVWEGFFDAFAGPSGSFWTLLANISPQEVAECPLSVDLNCFAGAWRYQDGGRIEGISETNFTPRTVAAATIRAMVDQYLEAMAVLDPESRCADITLAGGVPRRIPAFQQEIARRSGRSVRLSQAEEETLAGLCQLARQF